MNGAWYIPSWGVRDTSGNCSDWKNPGLFPHWSCTKIPTRSTAVASVTCAVIVTVPPLVVS